MTVIALDVGIHGCEQGVPLFVFSFLNCLGQVTGGAVQMFYGRMKAQTLGRAFLAQISGVMRLHPKTIAQHLPYQDSAGLFPELP